MWHRFLFLFILLLSSSLISTLSLATMDVKDQPLKIIAGTSLIEDIVKDLTDGKAEILTLTPGSSCPGHENAKTQDYVFATNADIMLLHSFQRSLPQIASLLEVVDNGNLQNVILETHGSWLIPDNQKNASREIALALINSYPQLSKKIELRLQERLDRIDNAEKECRISLEHVQGKNVFSAAMQTDFVKWAGLNVFKSYGRMEDMSASTLAEILRSANNIKISGVIDNRQSGGDAGLPLALELGIPHIILSNFPGSSPDVPDYFSLLRHNVKAISNL